jgi:FAD/FMN-containing dehydrogenase
MFSQRQPFAPKRAFCCPSVKPLRKYRLMNFIDGSLLTPADEGFDTARQAWNLAVDQRPDVIAFANDADEVAAAVRTAAERGLRVALQGTGHGAACMGDLAGTLLLKTMRLTGLEVDPGARRARAEAGVLWADVAVAAGEHGLAALHGSSAAASAGCRGATGSRATAWWRPRW